MMSRGKRVSLSCHSPPVLSTPHRSSPLQSITASSLHSDPIQSHPVLPFASIPLPSPPLLSNPIRSCLSPQLQYHPLRFCPILSCLSSPLHSAPFRSIPVHSKKRGPFGPPQSNRFQSPSADFHIEPTQKFFGLVIIGFGIFHRLDLVLPIPF